MMFKRFIILIVLILSSLIGFSQTTYFNLSGGGSLPTGWSGTNNITGQPFDKGSYYLLEPGSPGDLLTTSPYDLCTHTSATFTVDIGSYGSGAHNALKVEISLDGGTTYTQTYITTATTGSAESPITPITISPVSSTVVVRLSVNSTSGRGIRMQNLKLVGNGSITCGGGSSFTVTFDGNGNDGGTMSNQTASSSTSLTSNAYTQTGCTFTEWNTASDGSGTSYADGATYNFTTDIPLYVQWNCSPPSGGNCIDEDFVNFSDWTNNGTVIDNTSGHSGASSPSIALGSGNDLTSPTADNPTQLEFYQDASSGGNGSSALVEYSLDGGATWVTCYTFNVNSSGTTETVNLTNVGGVDLSTFTGVIFKFSSSFNTWYLDDVTVTCGVVINTLTTGSVSGSPFSVMCAASDNGSVAFTSTDIFLAGNTYTAQLSDASGNFGSPLDIGTLSSTANSGFINITIPAGTSTGAGYKIRITSSNPTVTGSESSSFTITLTDGPCASTTPEITGILIDACGATEGIDEFFTFENGNSSLNMSDFSVDFPNGETYCNSGCGTKTWTTNPTYVTQLNTTAGCPGLFIEQDPIPASGKTFVFSGSTPSYNFDFSGLCGTGPYYAIFANNTSTTGRFGNYNADCAQFRSLTVNFGSGNSDAVSYQRCALSDTDGDYISFDAAGTGTYNNDGCTPTAILPITLLNFKGKKQGNGSNQLDWITSSEINNEYFSIERSLNAIDFNEIGTINGAGNSNSPLNYSFIDKSPLTNTNYYRLKQTDFNGNYSYSSIIALNNTKNGAKIFISNDMLQISLSSEITKGSIQIFNTLGKTIHSESITSNKQISTRNFTPGIYIIRVITPSGNIIQKVKF